MLMLEATIGLNDVANGPKTIDPSGSPDVESEEGGPFTSNDLNFLKSLRICIEGED